MNDFSDKIGNQIEIGSFIFFHWVCGTCQIGQVICFGGNNSHAQLRLSDRSYAYIEKHNFYNTLLLTKEQVVQYKLIKSD